ncbi:MAG: TonB-dependent copper receptor [Cephaloticoccus sp.]|nr:TonB-dependent copper receptor [Cephaloticoccus sp.]
MKNHLFWRGVTTTLLSAAAFASAQTSIPSLDPLVVTGTAVADKPLEATLDAKAPAQPIPAQDGADFLKTVPGFSVSRKGGAGGEIVLRGQAGSRVDILLDGESVLGGCPHRMDPPTAYVFPGSFDRVTVLKGPQTVLHGPGNSAGVVLFERTPERFATTDAALEGSLTFGSFGRNDQTAEVKAGTPDFYAQGSYARTQSDDYEDGNGNPVHSQYDRSNLRAATGWTPDANTLLELSATRGEGEAAYGHSMMDATQLDHDNLSLRFRKTAISPQIAKVEAQVAYNHVDHIMDDFRLRTPGMMMMGESRLDHRLLTGRALIEWTPAENLRVSTGADFRDGRHRSHDTGSWVTDAEIGGEGVFAEITRDLSAQDRLIAGLRFDSWNATDKRATISGGMMGGSSPNPTANEKRTDTLPGGFVRYERDLADAAATAYLGVGYTERAPDYWELITNESATTKSSFHTATEKTTQVDTGLNYRSGPFSLSIAAFVNQVDDYILVQSNVAKPSGMMGGMGGMGMMMSTVTITRNVDASSWGGELGAGYAFDEHWKLDASLAYVRGRNRTDDLPLAQQPPLEGRLSLVYATPVWSVGGLARFVDAQNRVAVNQGTIIGQDLGNSPGFTVFSLNAGWRINDHVTLTAGVDNLLDETYAEHISRGGAAIAGYPVTTRINEPGRTLWLKADFRF